MAMSLHYKGNGVKVKGKPHYTMSHGIAGRNAYEGGSTAPRMGRKGLFNGGPNSVQLSGLRNTRSRARHAVRNNPYATRAVETYVTNLVGNGIKASWSDKELQKRWNTWVECCDADGDESFHGLTGLVARGQFEAGEALARLRVARNASGVPLKLQVFEADHLDESHNAHTSPNKWVRMGIEFNDQGKRSHYHLWKNHPSDNVLSQGNKRVRVKADDIVHVYRKLRAGQIRGVTELSPVLIRLYELDEMQDATLVRQKTSAMFAAFVKLIEQEDPDIIPAAESAPPVESDGSTAPPEQSGPPVPPGLAIDEISPGHIHYLEDGEDVVFSQPADIAGIYPQYIKTELRAVAAGMGITYEQLTGDLEGVNYSSIRAGLVEFRRRMEFLQLTLLVFKFCRVVAAKWLRMAVVYGVAPSHITRENHHEYLPEWRPPRWEWVDPLKDVQADMLEVRAGFDTKANKQLERGNDPMLTDAQLSKEQESDLVLDTNPAKVQKSGAIQQYETAGEGERSPD